MPKAPNAACGVVEWEAGATAVAYAGISKHPEIRAVSLLAIVEFLFAPSEGADGDTLTAPHENLHGIPTLPEPVRQPEVGTPQLRASGKAALARAVRGLFAVNVGDGQRDGVSDTVKGEVTIDFGPGLALEVDTGRSVEHFRKARRVEPFGRAQALAPVGIGTVDGRRFHGHVQVPALPARVQRELSGQLTKLRAHPAKPEA